MFMELNKWHLTTSSHTIDKSLDTFHSKIYCKQTVEGSQEESQEVEELREDSPEMDEVEELQESITLSGKDLQLKKATYKAKTKENNAEDTSDRDGFKDPVGGTAVEDQEKRIVPF